MIFKRLAIKNYRNFLSTNIELNNRNAIFGMNDVGKTNLLHAIRTVFDRGIRSKGFVPSDYHKNDTTKKIEIIVELDISDRNEDTEQGKDSKLLISKAYDARNNLNEPDSFVIKLEGVFDENEIFGNPILSWGSTIDTLKLVPNKGQFFVIDSIFHVEYVSPNSNLESMFKKHKRQIFNNDSKTEHDLTTEENIDNNISSLNENIGKLNVVKKVQEELTLGYQKLRNENLNIELKSEVSISGYLDNLTPYIKWNDDDNYYPTSGDGRKKLLSYALTNIITEKVNNLQIVIYLIEEPENSLHHSMQVALSRQLFSQQVYNYFFLTTHSSEVLYDMDNTQLIRISNSGDSYGQSSHYCVPLKYRTLKKQLNKGLSKALFYDCVLLVEGGSEFCLFEAVLDLNYPEMEIEGKFILQVDGINFEPYTIIFNELNIRYLVKTDNDLQLVRGNNNKYSMIGLNRCLSIINSVKKDSITFKFSEELSNSEKEAKIKQKKRDLFEEFTLDISNLNKHGIYLSEIDLEHDLYKVIPEELKNFSGSSNPVKWLQSKKLYNMIDFVENIDKDIAEKIIAGFPVLKEFVGDG